MIHLFLAAALAVAPAPVANPAEKHADHHKGMEAGCKMECCKGDKPMPCCEKMKAAANETAEAPAGEGHGAHEHDH